MLVLNKPSPFVSIYNLIKFQKALMLHSLLKQTIKILVQSLYKVTYKLYAI